MNWWLCVTLVITTSVFITSRSEVVYENSAFDIDSQRDGFIAHFKNPLNDTGPMDYLRFALYEIWEENLQTLPEDSRYASRCKKLEGTVVKNYTFDLPVNKYETESGINFIEYQDFPTGGRFEFEGEVFNVSRTKFFPGCINITTPAHNFKYSLRLLNWQFETTDPTTSYVCVTGELSLQAFTIKSFSDIMLSVVDNSQRKQLKIDNCAELKLDNRIDYFTTKLGNLTIRTPSFVVVDDMYSQKIDIRETTMDGDFYNLFVYQNQTYVLPLHQHSYEYDPSLTIIIAVPNNPTTVAADSTDTTDNNAGVDVTMISIVVVCSVVAVAVGVAVGWKLLSRQRHRQEKSRVRDSLANLQTNVEDDTSKRDTVIT